MEQRPRRMVELHRRRAYRRHRPAHDAHSAHGAPDWGVPELLTSDGVRLHYTCSGPDDAPRLVLLHGLGSDGAAGDEVIDALGERLHVARLDLRGHGLSEALVDPAKYEWFGRAAADVVELMDRLGWDDATVAGGSLGAATAVAVALAYPDRLRRLGVFAPAFGAGPDAGNPMAHTFFTNVASMGLMGVLDVLESLPEPLPRHVIEDARRNWSRQDDAAMRACVTALADAVLLDDLADLDHVDVPALVVGHHGDLLHPWELAESFAANLPHARLVGFDSSADVTPEAMADLLANFVTDL
jgi:3-oxoadipate enol-lactonase